LLPSVAIDPAFAPDRSYERRHAHSLPQNGAVVTLLAVCGSTHRERYFDIGMAAIVGPIIALVVVIALGSAFGSFQIGHIGCDDGIAEVQISRSYWRARRRTG
jgi:hypothetical protein